MFFIPAASNMYKEGATMHDLDFFRDEIRNGFYIPTAIKQSWAAELSGYVQG